jgi:hypothetical protein
MYFNVSDPNHAQPRTLTTSIAATLGLYPAMRGTSAAELRPNKVDDATMART